MIPQNVPVIGGAKKQPSRTDYVRAQNNPLPDGDEGTAILRGLSECPIPEESKKMNDLLTQMIKREGGSNEEIELAMAKGIAAALRANTYCRSNTKARTVCVFKDEAGLNELHTSFMALEKEAQELNDKLELVKQKLAETYMKRWQSTVKLYGLDIEKYSYRINEVDGTVEQVHLNCPECKGSTKLRKARQDTAENLRLTTKEENT